MVKLSFFIIALVLSGCSRNDRKKVTLNGRTDQRPVVYVTKLAEFRMGKNDMTRLSSHT